MVIDICCIPDQRSCSSAWVRVFACMPSSTPKCPSFPIEVARKWHDMYVRLLSWLPRPGAIARSATKSLCTNAASVRWQLATTSYRRPAGEQDEWCMVVTETLDAHGYPIDVDGGHRVTACDTRSPRLPAFPTRVRFTGAPWRGRTSAATSCRGGPARTAGSRCAHGWGAGPLTSRRSALPSCATVHSPRGRSARSSRRS